MTEIPATTAGLGKLAPGVGHLGLREQPVRRPEPGEALLEVLAAGVCGTDLHIADDEFPVDPPVTMGHEVTGVVVEVGPGVSSEWVGQRVACETYASYCETCDYCRAGSPNLCDRRRSIGSRVDGGFARWLTLPARNVHSLPAHVGEHAGALAEPLACVCHCLFDPGVIDPGDRVLVVGPGTMGILTAQAAQAAGGDVLLAGLARDQERLAVAAALGMATYVVDDGAPPSGRFDLVAECSGSAAGAQLAFEHVARRGRYVQVGIFGSPVTVDLDAVLYGEITVTSGNASTPQSWRRAMRLLHQRRVALDPLVTEAAPLGEWERVFAAVRAGQGVKYVLDPRRES
jgi:L-iditol 2-dehydrogenase